MSNSASKWLPETMGTPAASLSSFSSARNLATSHAPKGTAIFNDASPERDPDSTSSKDEDGGAKLLSCGESSWGSSGSHGGVAIRSNTDSKSPTRGTRVIDPHSDSGGHAPALERLTGSQQDQEDEMRRAQWKDVIPGHFQKLITTVGITGLTLEKKTTRVNRFLQFMTASPTNLDRLRDSIVSAVRNGDERDFLWANNALATISSIFRPLDDSEMTPSDSERADQWHQAGHAVRAASEAFQQSVKEFSDVVSRLEHANAAGVNLGQNVSPSSESFAQCVIMQDLVDSARTTRRRVEKARRDFSSVAALLRQTAWCSATSKSRAEADDLRRREEALKEGKAVLKRNKKELARRILEWEKSHSIEHPVHSDASDSDTFHTPRGSSDGE